MAAGLGGSCAVGPDFIRPAAPETSRYTREKLASVTGSADVAGGAAQRFVEGLDIPGEWWTLFRSKALNQLVVEALKANPTLAAEQAYVAQAAFFPTATGGFAASRNKSSAGLSPVTSTTTLFYSLFTPNVTVSYTPDV